MGSFTNLLKIGLEDVDNNFTKSKGIINLGTTSPIPGFEQTEEAKKARILQSFKEKQGKGFGPAIASLGKTILQETAKSGASVGLSTIAFGIERLGPYLGLTKNEASEEANRVRTFGIKDNKVAKAIFGTDVLKSIETRIAETEVKYARGGKFKQALAKPIFKVGETEITPVVFGVGAMILLDFTGAGGKKGVVKYLTKLDKVGDVANVLKKIGVADDLIPTYSKIISKLKKADDVKKALDNIENIQKTSKALVPIRGKDFVLPAQTPERTISPIIKAKRRIAKSIEEHKELATKSRIEDVKLGIKSKAEAKALKLKGIKEEKEFLASIKTGIREGLESVKNKIRKQIGFERFSKELSSNTLARIKEKNGIKEWSNATMEQLQSVLDDVKKLQKGDTMISRSQVEGLKEFGISASTTKREAAGILGDIANWKDKTRTRFANFFKTIDQKIQNVAGKDTEKMKNILTRPREEAVTKMFKEEIALKVEMKRVLNNLKVNNKKDRALIMRFGEGRITLDELKKVTPKWQGVIDADKWFRKQYDDLLEATNKELSRFYPESKLIPKRKDYYTHSQELGNMWDLFRNKGGDISPVLEQVSEFTKPNRKFNPFALRREGEMKFVEDAGKAFEAYLTPILHNKYMTESIVRHRAVADLLAHNTLKTKNINQFIFSLRDAADNLAGKTNPFDRALMNRVLGRKPIQLINALTRRMGKNKILGNIGSALMQISGIPNSVMKNNIIRTTKGLLSQAVSPLLGKNDPLTKSKFLLRRYGEKGLQHGESVFSGKVVGEGLRQGLKGTIKKGEKITSIPFELIEKNITKGIWRASFDNAWSQGFRGQELIQKADEITASIVGSRSIGEKALAFDSGVLSLPLQFQLEVNTHAQLWKDEVFSKIFKDPLKATRAAIETSISLFLMNTLFEKTMGRTPLPDPIRAIGDAMEADVWYEKVGRIAGEGLSSVAGGQFIANLLPRDLKKKYFGRSEVGIYPGGIPIVSVLRGGFRNPTNFVYDFVLPYGGGQLKKILQGTEGLDKMGSFNKSGKLQFPINQNQWLKVITFGKYSTKEAKEYFDKQRSPLTEKQTVEYFFRTQEGEKPQDVYNDIAKDKIRKEYEREIIKKVVKKIKSNPDEGMALIQLWKSQGIISNEMEKDILEEFSK